VLLVADWQGGERERERERESAKDQLWLPDKAIFAYTFCADRSVVSGRGIVTKGAWLHGLAMIGSGSYLDTLLDQVVKGARGEMR
jgi:hypothetical protein